MTGAGETILFAVMAFFFLFILYCCIAINIQRRQFGKHDVSGLSTLQKAIRNSQTYSPASFFAERKEQTGDAVGVYIIKNTRTDQYYVGQAKRLFFRVNQHFTGHGNGDVYADYKRGHPFKIKLIKLSESGYCDLDELEKDLIHRYDAFRSGYNRTNGNG